jgi:flagellar motility protein MotE (MotC chaperone)
MKRFWRDVRLIPVVLLATVSLFVLKVSGLVFDGGYTLAERLENRNGNGLRITSADTIPAQPRIILADVAARRAAVAPGAPKPWAQEMFNFNADSRDITGSVGEKKDETKSDKTEDKKDEKQAEPHATAPTRIGGMPVSDKPPEPTRVEVGGAVVQNMPGRVSSPGERAVLERLQERRQELDNRRRELDMRENLLKAAEQRMEAKLGELKSIEAKIDRADTKRQQADSERFKSIVAMYENMKSKDAARIFDRLDMKILVEVSTQMKPAKMAEILGQMSPEAAERLTVELANRASGAKPGPEQLPKIEGRPES